MGVVWHAKRGITHVAEGVERRLAQAISLVREHFVKPGYWNVGIAILALAPVGATFLAINLLVGQAQLGDALGEFAFDTSVSAETIRALYVFGLSLAAFALVAPASITVCITAQYHAAPEGRRRRGGLWAASLFAIAFGALMIAEPWAFIWPQKAYHTPDYLFSGALDAKFHSNIEDASAPIRSVFDRVQSLFRLSVIVVIVVFTFAASAAAACASPIDKHGEARTSRLRFIESQVARHHRVFYSAALALLAMLFVGKARLDVHQAILNPGSSDSILAGFKELRLGLEVYWGGVLTLCLATIYVPTAWFLHHSAASIDDGPANQPATGQVPTPDGTKPPSTASPPAVALKLGLILLPSLFSGGVSELIKSILEQ